MLQLAILLCARGAGQGPLSSELFTIVNDDGRYGFIDSAGKIVIRPQFLWADAFQDGYAEVYVCGRPAYIDRAGGVYSFNAGAKDLQRKKIGDKFGFVTASGHLRIPARFDEVRPFSDGVAAVREGGKWGFIDESGNYTIQPGFVDAYYFNDGVGLAAIDSEKTLLIKHEDGSIDKFGEDVLIDKAGKVTARGYQFRQNPSEGRVAVWKDGQVGFIDYQGKLVIPLVYDTAFMFSEGLAPVEKKGKWGYIDYKGNIVIPLEFDHAEWFGQGLAPAVKGGRSGFIDQTGKFVFFLPFRQASGFQSSQLSAFWTEDDKFGYVNRAGKVVWGPVKRDPEHWPLLGWSEEDVAASCKGIPEDLRNQVLRFPRVAER